MRTHKRILSVYLVLILVLTIPIIVYAATQNQLSDDVITLTTTSVLSDYNTKNEPITLTTTGPLHPAQNIKTESITLTTTAPISDYNTKNEPITLTTTAELNVTITASAGAGGSISPSETVSRKLYTNQTFTITPDTYYNVSDVLVDGASVGAVSSYTFTNLNDTHTIEAQFTLGTTLYYLTISAPGGSGSGSTNPTTGTHTYANGTSVQVTATPTGSTDVFTNWILDDANSTSNPITVTMDQNHTLQAIFGQQLNRTLTIDTPYGSGTCNMSSGSYQIANYTIYATPDSGYTFQEWYVNSSFYMSDNPYTFELLGNTTLQALFRQDGSSTGGGGGGGISPGDPDDPGTDPGDAGGGDLPGWNPLPEPPDWSALYNSGALLIVLIIALAILGGELKKKRKSNKDKFREKTGGSPGWGKPISWALLLILVFSSVSAVSAAPNIDRAISIGYWENQAINDRYTEAEVKELATRYNYFITRYEPQVAQIREVNPDAFIMYYRNFEAVYYSPVSDCNDPWSEYPDFVANGTLLKNSDGNYLINKQYPNERMVDPANQWYRDYMKTLVKEKIDQGYSAIFADCLRAFIDDSPWHYGEKPVNPRTGQLYTHEEYARDVRGLIAYIKQDQNIVIIANGINQANGDYGYYAHQQRIDQLITCVDGQMIEGPFGWSSTEFNSRTQREYEQNLQLLKELMRTDKLSYLHNPEVGNMMFCFNSFMLIMDPFDWSCMSYGGASMHQDSEQWQQLTGYDYGEPLEPYQVNGDQYSRRFEKATIHLDYSTKEAWITYQETTTEPTTEPIQEPEPEPISEPEPIQEPEPEPSQGGGGAYNPEPISEPEPTPEPTSSTQNPIYLAISILAFYLMKH